jgi:hypothetical protein
MLMVTYHVRIAPISYNKHQVTVLIISQVSLYYSSDSFYYDQIVEVNLSLEYARMWNMCNE